MSLEETRFPRPEEPRFRTLKLLLAYDGTNYVGWQRQPSGVSIQQLIEQALAPFAGDESGPTVVGAGRTDAGVHAAGQVASATVSFDHGVDEIKRALNVWLPQDVRVLEVTEARSGFHARFDSKGKLYRYRIVTSPVVSPFERWFVWHAPGRLDVEVMRRAAAVLPGRHDFASFQASGSATIDTTRTIDRLDIIKSMDGISLEVEGDGFLRHMVRAIAGTLVEMGQGSRDPDSMPAVLAARDRRAAGRTAPASGLTLVAVRYC
jgi:tRNA pseudouridine38-40 synthase